MWTETKIVPSTWYIFNVQGCTHTDFHICALNFYWLSWGTDRFLQGKAKRCFRDWPFFVLLCFVFFFAFLVILSLICSVIMQILINMWKSDHMKAWNSIRNDCGGFIKNHMQWQLNSLNSQSVFCTRSEVCILHLVCSLYPVCSLYFVMTVLLMHCFKYLKIKQDYYVDVFQSSDVSNTL